MSCIDQYIEILDKEDLNHSDVETVDGNDIVHFGMDLKNVKGVNVLIVFDECSASVIVRDIASVPDDKFGDGLIVCNELNNQYRFSRFTVTDDNEFCAQTDALVDEHSAGDEAWAMTINLLKRVDEAYARLMKAIWA